MAGDPTGRDVRHSRQDDTRARLQPETPFRAPGDRDTLDAVTLALTRVRKLLDRKDYIIRELVAVDFELRAAWRDVPHMPVRSALQMELEERRDAVITKAAHGDSDVARILRGLMNDDYS